MKDEIPMMNKELINNSFSSKLKLHLVLKDDAVKVLPGDVACLLHSSFQWSGG